MVGDLQCQTATDEKVQLLNSIHISFIQDNFSLKPTPKLGRVRTIVTLRIVLSSRSRLDDESPSRMPMVHARKARQRHQIQPLSPWCHLIDVKIASRQYFRMIHQKTYQQLLVLTWVTMAFNYSSQNAPNLLHHILISVPDRNINFGLKLFFVK